MGVVEWWMCRLSSVPFLRRLKLFSSAARGGRRNCVSVFRLVYILCLSVLHLYWKTYPFVIRVCHHCSMPLKLAGALRKLLIRTSAMARNGHPTNMSPLSIPGRLNKQTNLGSFPRRTRGSSKRLVLDDVSTGIGDVSSDGKLVKVFSPRPNLRSGDKRPYPDGPGNSAGQRLGPASLCRNKYPLRSFASRHYRSSGKQHIFESAASIGCRGG